jgi:hypothetical protein
MATKGHWLCLPHRLVKDLPGLRISPLRVVPQAERRPRTIVDYTYSQVNKATIKQAPQEAMQFGRTLQRVLQAVVYADPAQGPVCLFKLDIADGFYRVWVAPQDVPKLAVVLPKEEGEEAQLAFPLALPMGWVESPPYFCAVTETITDLANEALRGTGELSRAPHRLDAAAGEQDAILADSRPADKGGVRQFDVYVDDFIGAAQGDRSQLQAVRRTLFEAVDRVFRPLEGPDTPFHREEPVSLKKLGKGNGAWSTKKVILGWEVDTQQLCIRLTERRKKRLDEILDSLKYRTSDRISVKDWHKVLGELRSMSLAVPGSRGLFGILQEALRHKQKGRIRLTQAVDDLLEDFRWVVQDLTARPTHLYELFPDRRYHLGACDACKAGMGGVWYPYGKVDPLVWRVPFPSDVQKRVVTIENPHGCITNSDLELAASILHLDVATSNFAERLHTIAVLSDNSPTVYWQQKGSTTTTKATSYLLRVQALHQRHFAYHATFDHIPGAANVMANFASRAWDLSDDAFAVSFSSSYPQPGSWMHSTPRSEMISALISALLSKRPAPESFLPPGPRSGVGSDAGRSFSAVSALSTRQIPFSIRTYSSLMSSTTRASRSFSCSSPGSAVDVSLAVNQRELHQWKMPFVPFHRNAKWTDAPIPLDDPGPFDLTSE